MGHFDKLRKGWVREIIGEGIDAIGACRPRSLQTEFTAIMDAPIESAVAA